ncbi:hypothetical protein ANANG_G00003520 [Anguilla anguilla]|uniref:Uncharacterized protein n=1 Tax=Anguilla anguilla TaxID=7936 RepID=A0A9D3MZ72_ANGAN|nr:hypothetical protein ANANG_G00003520 [Anguilla anguilla]
MLKEDMSNVQIMCAWCQKVGVKRYSLSMGSELKSFCSEKCFAACRRAYFKRNKLGYIRSYPARDEDGQAEKLPPQSYGQDTPRLVFKINSDVLVCDWCKHIRHTKEYLDFGAGERRLQFCSAKCLNQYKMDIFYKETQAALPGAGHGGEAGGRRGGAAPHPRLLEHAAGRPAAQGPVSGRRAPVPGPSGSSSASPSESSSALCPSSSSGKIPTPGPRPHESPALAPPVPALHPPMGVPPGAPHGDDPAGPCPSPSSWSTR